MDYNQQDIFNHKTKLLNLINNLINTQLVQEEIFINNEIKKESEYLSSLLNSKQITLMNQINQNNNLNFNPLLFQPNMMMNLPQMNINQMVQNDFNPENNQKNNEQIINVKFIKDNINSKLLVFHCSPNEKISDVIEKYRKKANDYNENFFVFNNEQIGNLTSTLSQIGIKNQSTIFVLGKGGLKG